VFAQVLPPVMLGSLTAILLAGTLNFVGKRYPQWTGEGRLQPGEHDDMDTAREDTEDEKGAPIDVGTVAAAGLAAITLYLMGVMCHRLFGLPAPVAMLFLAVLAKLTSAVSPHLQQGGFVVYKFFSTAVTYPLLFAIGVSMTPWDKLMAAFNLPNLITIVSTVATLMATGGLVGYWLNMYPIETAIINACHSGQGGTGDVAILTAANRMQLMPLCDALVPQLRENGLPKTAAGQAGHDRPLPGLSTHTNGSLDPAVTCRTLFWSCAASFSASSRVVRPALRLSHITQPPVRG
jgi:malate:Na+ symporter